MDTSFYKQPMSNSKEYIDELKYEIRQKQYLVDLLESDRMMSKLKWKDMVLYQQHYKERNTSYWLAEVKFKIRNWEKQARIRITLGNVDTVDPNDHTVQENAVRKAKELWNKRRKELSSGNF